MRRHEDDLQQKDIRFASFVTASRTGIYNTKIEQSNDNTQIDLLLLLLTVSYFLRTNPFNHETYGMASKQKKQQQQHQMNNNDIKSKRKFDRIKHKNRSDVE